MKLFRFGQLGSEKPGIVDKNGGLRDLSSVVQDIDAWALSDEGLKHIAAVDVESLPLIDDDVRFGVPVAHVPNLIGIGLNYTDHAEETNAPIPSEPIIFNKHTSSLSGANDPVILPTGSEKLDWEVELGFVIGKPCWNVSEAEALDYVAGYMIVNDISERYFQLEREGQWTKGKSHPTFAPCGPFLVTRDDVPDPQTLDLWLDLNGKRVQNGKASRMIFSCANLLSQISRYLALQPGDIVTTGTPPGVGLGMIPPAFMKAGDVMKLGVTGLGEQEQKIVPYTDEMAADWCARFAATRQ